MQITYTSYKKDNSVYISIYLHGTTTQIANFEVAKIDEHFDRLADGTFLKIGDNVLNETNGDEIKVQVTKDVQMDKDELIKDLYSNIMKLQQIALKCDNLQRENCQLVQDNLDLRVEIIKLQTQMKLLKMDINLENK